MDTSYSYDLTYAYQSGAGHRFQLDNVRDLNYHTEETPSESTTVNNGHRYEYDANGNLIYVNTSRVKRDGKEDEKSTEQKFRWDEENRLLAVDENGYVSNYWYDANGERTVKESGGNQAVYVNSEFAGGRTNTAKFSLYVSPFFVATQGGRYTKHIYIGNQRIVSKLGDLASYGQDPRRIPYAGTVSDAISVDYDTKYALQQQVIKDNYETFEVPYNGEDNNDYVNGQSFCCEDDTPKSMQTRAGDNFHDKDAYEKLQFYYHPDLLGSSSYISNLDGEVVQHIEYVPFGEVFIEERNNTWNTPYLFNAKELDEETGLYYYGARYYDPRLSLWMSTDPLQEKYSNISTYCYTANNPIKYVDPTGLELNPIYDFNGKFLGTDDKGLQGEAIVMSSSNFKQGMSHKEAINKGVRYSKSSRVITSDAFKKIGGHASSLRKRPDFDGSMSYNELVEWGKQYGNSPVYLDASKIDLGSVSIFDFDGVGSSAYINTVFRTPLDTYGPIGKNKMTLINNSGQVRLSNDIFDYDQHNLSKAWNEGVKVFAYELFVRTPSIAALRIYHGIDSSFGFPMYFYGLGQLKVIQKYTGPGSGANLLKSMDWRTYSPAY